MIIDVVTLITPTDPSMRGMYLAPSVAGATNPNITYVAPPSDDGTIDVVYAKGFVLQNGTIAGSPIAATAANPVVGYGPWDWMTATQSWIRQKLTERVWTNLATGKLECVSGLGVRRLPRWIITDATGFCEFQWSMQEPETRYLIFDPPTAATTPYPLVTVNSDAGVRCTFRGPYSVPALGDLPAGFDWIEDYEWGGKLVSGVMVYNTLERVTHRQGFGRYMWQAFASNGSGGYNPTPTSQSQQTSIQPLPSNWTSLKPIQHVF